MGARERERGEAMADGWATPLCTGMALFPGYEQAATIINPAPFLISFKKATADYFITCAEDI